MDTLEAIFTRRSVRQYTPQPVPEELVEKLLRAAMQAPSSSNGQPWHFVVIRDRRLLDEIPQFHQFAEMLPQASVAILVCGDERLEKRRGCWAIDCAAATQNILLAAHALGLGAVWTDVHLDEKRVVGMRELLGLPDHIHPLSLVPVGYPDEHPEPVDRFDASRIHLNAW